uniref:Uncharacterized protein n=1 Tax=viral metagenome TaxID=1070528 RepID=A0A6C0EDY5_9ZZZZ
MDKNKCPILIFQKTFGNFIMFFWMTLKSNGIIIIFVLSAYMV